MRVTDGMRHTSMVTANREASEQVFAATRRATSGLKVEAPKDGAAAFSRVTARAGTMARVDDHLRAASLAESEMTLAESALAQAGNIMTRVRELALQAADGGLSPENRSMIAKEVTELRQALVGVGNTKGATGYVFAGTKTDVPPFAPAGTFLGNDTARDVDVGTGSPIRGNPSGAQAFTAAGGRDVIADLDALATALSSNNIAAAQASISNIDEGQKQITNVRGETGVAIDRFRGVGEVQRRAKTALEAAMAGDREIDQVEAYTDLTSAEGTYDRSLTVARKLIAMFSMDKLQF